MPWLTVAENLRLVAPKTTPEILRRVLTELGLAASERLCPRELSLGMARRVALARALISAPLWLVLDEPFASLDPGNTAALANVVGGYAESSKAPVLLATHELDVALAMADRVLVIAGSPTATLALDMPVRTRSVAAVRGELMARFPFLGGGAAEATLPTLTGD